MGVFVEEIVVEKSIRLNRRDLITIEEMMKYGDSDSIVYGEEHSGESYFKYFFKYKKGNTVVSDKMKSILELKSEHENLDLTYLKIQRMSEKVHEEYIFKNTIELEIREDRVFGILKGDNTYWTKQKKLLLEDFLNDKQLKSIKFSNWINNKYIFGGYFISLFLLVNSVILMEPVLLFIGAILNIITAIFSLMSLRHKVFSKNLITFKQNFEEGKMSNQKRVLLFVASSVYTIALSVLSAHIYFLINP